MMMMMMMMMARRFQCPTISSSSPLLARSPAFDTIAKISPSGILSTWHSRSNCLLKSLNCGLCPLPPSLYSDGHTSGFCFNGLYSHVMPAVLNRIYRHSIPRQHFCSTSGIAYLYLRSRTPGGRRHNCHHSARDLKQLAG